MEKLKFTLLGNASKCSLEKNLCKLIKDGYNIEYKKIFFKDLKGEESEIEEIKGYSEAERDAFLNEAFHQRDLKVKRSVLFFVAWVVKE